MRCTASTVLSLVLFVTYIGIGALAHDTHFSLAWALIATLLVWVRAVATAVLAGVIAQIVVQPPGALASVPDWLRYSAVVAGFAAFMLARKSIFVGVVVGEIVMLAGKWWLG